jgi:hypothetical protein
MSLYEQRAMEGFFLFAGSSIPKLNASMWREWDLMGNLAAMYSPWIGRACGTVGRASVEVRYGLGDAFSDTFTRVASRAKGGRLCFGGWVGREGGAVPHVLSVDGNDVGAVQLVAGKTVSFKF